MYSPTLYVMKNLLVGLMLLSPGFALAQTLLHLVTIPANTPRTDTLYLAGSFNNWNPADPASRLIPNADGTYQFLLPAAGTGTVDFKITRGSWSRVETDAQNADVANRQVNLAIHTATIDLTVANWKDRAGGSKPCVSTAQQPNVQVISATFPLPQLGRTRRIWVYLPHNYATDTTRRFPVLYMHDGQNVFDACTSFSGEWGVDETLSQLQKQGLDTAGSIVVAVDHGGAERLNELSPWRNPQHGGGQGEAYVDFLTQTLKPYIDATYRTLTSREFTGIAGSSMGGLISTYAALKYPLVYSKVGVFSPAFWFAEDSLRRFMQALPARPSGLRTAYYLVAGAQEGETMVPLMQQMQQELRHAADSLTNHTQLVVRSDGKHAEWFWRREFPAAYQWLQTQHTGLAGRAALPWAAWLQPGTRRLYVAAGQPQSGKHKVMVQLYNVAGQVVARRGLAAAEFLDLGRLPAGSYRLVLQQPGRIVRRQQPARAEQQLVLPVL